MIPNPKLMAGFLAVNMAMSVLVMVFTLIEMRGWTRDIDVPVIIFGCMLLLMAIFALLSIPVTVKVS